MSPRPYCLCLSASGLPSAGAQYDCPGTGPGVINHHPAGTKVQSWPSATEKAGCVCRGKDQRAAGPILSLPWPVVFARAKTSEPLDPYSLCLGRLCLPGLREAPLVQRGDSMAKPCKRGLWSQVDPIGFSAALGTGGDPAWGAKKVGEKPSFSPRASGSVTYRLASYFVLRRNNTLPRPKIPLWGFWSSSPQRRLWLLGGANLGRWEIKCSWAHRGVSP